MENRKVQKEEKMKKLLVTVLGVLFLLGPVFAMAGTITGSVQGYNSVAQSQAKNAHISAHTAATESTFVILAPTAKGGHYLIRNADRGVLAGLVNQQVKIDGDVDNGAESVKAKEIYAQDSGNSWKKVWSSNVNDDIYRDAFGAIPLPER